MGQNIVKNKRVLVIGLKGVGKTHFLDSFHYGSDTTKKPTHGYYEVNFKNTTWVELGGCSDWTKICRQLDSFDIICMIINMKDSIERLLESKSALLMMCREIPNVPVVILCKEYKNIFQFDMLSKSRTVLIFQSEEVLVEWIVTTKHVVGQNVLLHP